MASLRSPRAGPTMSSPRPWGEGLSDEYRQQVWEHARYLGMNPEVDGPLMWIAEESLRAEVPSEWLTLQAPDGTPYYYNEATQESRWTNPAEDHFRDLYTKKKADMGNGLPYTPNKGSSTSGQNKRIMLPPANAFLEEPDANEPKHQVGWIGTSDDQEDPSSGDMSEESRRLQNELYMKKKKLRDRENNVHSLDGPGDERYLQEIDRLQGLVRKLRGDREDLERTLGRMENDLDREVAFSRKLRKENDFLKRNMDEMEAELLNRPWDAVLADIEENLRGTFTKEQGSAEEEDWMVNVEVLQTMIDDLQAIFKAYKPYLDDSHGETNSPPATTTTIPPRQERSRTPVPGMAKEESGFVEQLRAQLKESQQQCAEVENKMKMLEMQLSISEQRRLDETNTLKDTIKNLTEAMARPRTPHAPANTGMSDEMRQELESLRNKVQTLRREADEASDRARSLSQELNSMKDKDSQRKDKLDTVASEKKKLERALDDMRMAKESAAKECESLRDQVREAGAAGPRELEAARSNFEDQVKQYKSRLNSLESELERCQKQLKASEEQVSVLEGQVSKYKKRVSLLEQEKQKSEESKEAEVKRMQEEADGIKAKAREEMEQTRAKARDETEQLRSRANKSAAMVEQLSGEIDECKAKAEQALARCDAQLRAKDEECKSTLEGLRAKNRMLNERILELQGNIRVLCRIRPMSRRELDANTGGPSIEQLIQYPEEGMMYFHDQKYEFDNVFRPDSEQMNIFKDVQSAVWSAVNGYRVSIFAYGQTGSGKTYTMEGPPEDRGVNLRAINEVFTLAKSQPNMEYAIKMSMLEVYNETIQDLLGDPSAQSKNGLDIRVAANKQVYVEGLTQCEVESMNDVESLMGLGSRNRHVGATNMNEHSSRSHLVLSLTIISTNKKTGARSGGKLNLIDLAGSERLKSTGATGDRLEEAKNINKSLSALGDVIASLASSNAHVPYRNSKLTFLLQDSLGQNAKVIMFVNINPAPASAQESICSLNFASRCRSVQLGTAKKVKPSAASGAKSSGDDGKEEKK